jgi:uncharacterized protein YfdQ (DUF2303 family)
MEEKAIVNSVTQIRDLAREAMEPRREELIHYVAAPAGTTLHSLEKFQYPHGIPPSRIVAAPRFQDSASFCSYVNTFKDSRTRVLADVETVTFLALLDYHGAGALPDGIPEFVSHRASFPLKHSDQWKLWMGQNDKLIPQAEFAEFLEDNRADVVDPDSATLVEIARDLTAHTDVNFASKINVVNGSAVLKYDEQVTASVRQGQILIPEMFSIRIPVFYGEEPTVIKARLRFRIGDGKLKFQYKLYRPQEVRQLAFDEAVGDIAAAVGISVLQGTLT